MPRNYQIIPQFLHPHEETYINDYTKYDELTADQSGPKFLCVFAGGKGRNTLQNKVNWSDFIREYGKPNYQKFGQAMYIPYVLLYSGYAQCQCLNVVAANATYANLIFAVGYKAEGEKFVMQYRFFSYDNLRNLDDLDVFANTIETTTPDDDGFKWLPMMTMWALGKGSYGTNFRFRFLHDKSADKENDYKNYSLQLLSTEDGNEMIEGYNVTLDTTGIDPLTRVTNYIDDVVNDVKGSGSKRIGCHFFHDNYQTLFNAFCEAYAASGTPTITTAKVDRLPSITAPSTSKLYHLTAADGSHAAGSLNVYDATNGVWNASSYTVQEVASLPAVASASTSIIYKIDNSGTSSLAAGSLWVTTDNANWVAGPEIVDCAYLPSAVTAVEGTIYELTVDRDSKAAGTMWTFDSLAGDFVSYTAPEAVEVDNPYTIGTWDMFGYNRFTKENEPFIEIVDGLGSYDFLNYEGLDLKNGSDGDFGDDVDTATREAAMEEAYINAFQGVTDKKVLSKRRAPIDLILDAGWSVNIKKAIVSLVTQRYDCMAQLDCGLLTNIDDIFDMGLALQSINTYLVSKDCGMFKTTDPVTGKIIPATITLWMADNIPTHFREYGNHTPMAGEAYAKISGYIPNTIRPEIDADDHETKEKLYADYRINYIEALDEETYIRGTQMTSQHDASDLSEENNVRVLLELKRKIERLAGKRRYRWAEPEDLALFKAGCQQYFSEYNGTKCKSCDIDVKYSDWEKTRYIVHIYLAVVFKTFQKTAIIEIDVNPRV